MKFTQMAVNYYAITKVTNNYFGNNFFKEKNYTPLLNTSYVTQEPSYLSSIFVFCATQFI